MFSQPVFLFKDIGNNKTTTNVKIIAFPPSPFSLPVCVEELVKTGRNDCLTTPQHKNKLAIECLINGIYINVKQMGRKEGNVLFNNALNTFSLWLYGIRHIVKYHSDSERGNLLPPHELPFPVSSKGSFICIIPQTG